MIETIELRGLFFGTMSGALVVLAGAFYALFFALAAIQRKRAFWAAAALSFAVLTLAVIVLAGSLDFSGVWLLVAAIILVAYLLAPIGIWKLCQGTHGDTSSTLETGAH